MKPKTTKPTGGQIRALVGNPDVYAVQDDKGDWRPVREKLTPAVIRRHRAGEITVGTYIVKPPDQARTLVFDFDDAGDTDTAAQVDSVTDILRDLDLNFIVEDSGGKGERYHIWVAADEYMSAETLYRLGRGIREEAGLPKLEVFPKQRQVRDLGNLVKLPGGTHRVTGRNNDLLAEFGFDVNTVDDLEEAADSYPEVAARSGPREAGIEWPCVAKIQQGVTEGGRNVALFHLATMLRKASLDDENTELVVRNVNAKFEPPLEDEELLAVLDHSKHSGPIHGQLDESYGCEGVCTVKHPGLYTRPGALKWAEDGEAVVVVVESRTDDGRVLELSHPDMIQGRAVVEDPPEKRKK